MTTYKPSPSPTRLWILGFLAPLLLAGVSFGPASAEPFVPINEDQVLERVQPTRLSAGWRSARNLRAQLRQQPHDRALAVRYATQALELATALGDPRHVGYAEAALAPWLDEAPVPMDVLWLRARIRQSRHDFDAALADLEHLLRQRPRTSQAWLARATLLVVRGEPEAARGSCAPLERLASPLVADACLAMVDGVQGQAGRAHQRLATTFDQASAGAPLEPSLERFVLGLLADLAHRLGDAAQAEAHFERWQNGPGLDVPGLVQRAEFLLDQHRPAEVVDLLRDETRTDTLLLRLTLAEQALGGSTVDEHVALLGARFASGRRRGEDHHQGEESRYRLHILDEPDIALTLALANWEQQREPADARRVLEAALATGNAQAAQPVLRWRATTGIECTELDRLVATLETLP